MIRAFAGKARQYMLAYYLLSQECKIDENNGGLINSAGEKITYEKI